MRAPENNGLDNTVLIMPASCASSYDTKPQVGHRAFSPLFRRTAPIGWEMEESLPSL